MTWSYSASNLNVTPSNQTVLKDQLRFLIGDTNDGDQLMQDEEVIFTLSQSTSIYGSAAVCCRSIATKYARKADSTQGPIRLNYSQISRNYNMMAAQYDNLSNSRSAQPGYAGGISVSDKSQREEDPDRVDPQFNIGMTDNFLPVAPAGNEESTFSDESQNL